MKTIALALLIPVALCTACSRQEEPMAAPESETADARPEATAPRPGTATTPGNAPAGNPAAEPTLPTAHAVLTAAAGTSVQGGFTLVNQGSGISIRGEITGLEPGSEHGFHVHEVGECSLPAFESAGGHFNPTKDSHGGPDSDARHLGDLPNAKADENGRALIDVNVQGVTLMDKDGAPTEILGKAIVVHAMRDDYKTQPSGDSGNRIACGVIR
ncbi:MAG: superoxide dismutase family protein [Pseudomonadota bacterium]|nr:superoxide dismutase family protein [Pseudomonadota bacterium]